MPAADLAAHWPVVANLLAGSLVGAWIGATWAVRMRSASLYRVLALLLVVIAVVLAATHTGVLAPPALPPGARVVAGVVAGAVIGVVAALMGVAGGELLIPTIVLLHGVDVTTAGSLSLVVSLPTMVVAFTRYSRDAAFAVLRANTGFVVVMSAGSITGTALGALLLGVVPVAVVLTVLVALLLASAVKVWHHR